MDSLNDLRVCSFQLADVIFGILDVFFDLVENVVEVFFFDERVFFEKFGFDHFAGLDEDGCCFKDVV